MSGGISLASLWSIAPELVLTLAGIATLLLDAFAPALRRAFTALSVAAVALAAWAAANWVPPGKSFDGLLEADGKTLAFSLIVLVSAALGLLASQGFLTREGILGGEYHALLLWSAAGMLLMLRSGELLTIFVALETLSLALYALAAYNRKVVVGTEAAVKYFLMGAFAGAFVLYGIALLYGETGSTHLDAIAQSFRAGTSSPMLAALGVVMLVAGFAFKMSLAPFHAWSPDTYQGAPSPFVAFLSVAPKVASAVVLMRILEAALFSTGFDWSRLVALLAVLSMAVGNLFALVQKDIKRMLAYSGIAHMGYLAIALVTLNRDSYGPVLVYLLAYALMNAGAFTVVAILYARPGEQHLISELSGWGYRFPLLGVCLTVCMLSLGGIPPTLGFLGKYLVFLHAVESGQLWLAVVGVATSLIGVFYYLRVVYTLYMRPEERAPEGLTADLWGRSAAVLAAGGVLVLGMWPSGLIDWMWSAVQSIY
jgi:NADH-quinone oxidoreductase subunit N